MNSTGPPVATRVKRPPSPAQIAIQVTFVLKGHLKNASIAYIRAAVLLARVRDEKLWRALRHPTIEDYAQRRLGLRRSALYQYLQIHDWLRDYHPAWLARRPRGFIPELTDVSALIWIEKKLRDPHLSDSLRAELEVLRKKGMSGTLTDEEFRRLRERGRRVVTPLRALLARLRAARRVAARIPETPPAVLAALDNAIRATAAAVDSSSRVARLADFRRRALRTRRGALRIARRRGRKPAPGAAGKQKSRGPDSCRSTTMRQRRVPSLLHRWRRHRDDYASGRPSTFSPGMSLKSTTFDVRSVKSP